MEKRKKRSSSNSIMRLVFVGISVLCQAGWILLQIQRLNEYSIYISAVSRLLALIVVLRLYSRHTTAALKLPWIMLILVMPVMGLSLYVMIDLFGDLGKTGKRLGKARRKTRTTLPEDTGQLEALAQTSAYAAGISRYLQRCAYAPLYPDSGTRYYGDTKEVFRVLKDDLKKAQKYIFMEYFIVEDGDSFWEIAEILAERAAAGVDVRLMYDDIGSVGYANFLFARKLNNLGIRCRVFNPALPVLNLFMNHRDHRKITVIDGEVGYTGGYNLADCYFDYSRPFGLWKDTGIRMEGEAVRSLTALFLEMWHTGGGEEEPEDLLREEIPSRQPTGGFVQPYGDDPLSPERVTENVYLSMISGAERSVWIMTPYLIISDEMIRALCLAAKRGLDVRIITPGVPDKKTVYQVTRSYYRELVNQGVRIFEYIPGFCHGKQCLCDGVLASIGTSNFDYRSLYHHFENNVLLYGGEAVEQMRMDFENMFPLSAEVTQRYRAGGNRFVRSWQCLLRLFAPLM